MHEIARRHDTTSRQVALAWLMARSHTVLAIPGTGSVAHAETNVAAARLELTSEEIATLTTIAGPTTHW